MSQNQAASQSSGASNAKKTFPREEWEKKMKAVKVNKFDLNKLIMNYLVIEGYKEAAEKFSSEASISPSFNLNSIEDRMNIRKAIQSGRIEEAIERVNDLDPEQQRLIELIRDGKIDEAIEFAQEELAPRGEENPEYLEELERTMALLAFNPDDPSPVSMLLDHSQRQKTASELNAAILTVQCQEKEPKLPSLIKMLIWAQNLLDEKATYPHIRNIATAELEDPSPVNA